VLFLRRPVAVQPWAPSTLDATQFRSSCPQPGGGGGTAEDCLYLNIYTRANDSATATMPGTDDDNDNMMVMMMMMI
jgi:carboxylesterase type B